MVGSEPGGAETWVDGCCAAVRTTNGFRRVLISSSRRKVRRLCGLG